MSKVLALLESAGSNASLRHAPLGSQGSYFGRPGSMTLDEVLEQIGLKSDQEMIPMIFPVE